MKEKCVLDITLVRASASLAARDAGSGRHQQQMDSPDQPQSALLRGPQTRLLFMPFLASSQEECRF